MTLLVYSRHTPLYQPWQYNMAFSYQKVCVHAPNGAVTPRTHTYIVSDSMIQHGYFDMSDAATTNHARCNT